MGVAGLRWAFVGIDLRPQEQSRPIAAIYPIHRQFKEKAVVEHGTVWVGPHGQIGPRWIDRDKGVGVDWVVYHIAVGAIKANELGRYPTDGVAVRLDVHTHKSALV